MHPEFYMSTVRYLAQDAFVRTMVNCGVNQADMDLFTGALLWGPDVRSRVRRVLDSVLYGICDMAMLPRVDIPAEIAASVIAMMVNPANWMIAAAWQEGLRPAQDLANSEETVQIERVSAGKMITMVCLADAALRNNDAYQAFAARLQGRMSLKLEIK